MSGRTIKRTFGLLYVLMAGLLFGSAVARADVVLDWNAIAVNTTIANGQNPFAQARYAAITQLAVFEAVNATTGDPAVSWDYRSAQGASADTAAIKGCVSGIAPTSSQCVDARRQRASSLALIADGEARMTA
jgi:hypothetical protein